MDQITLRQTLRLNVARFAFQMPEPRKELRLNTTKFAFETKEGGPPGLHGIDGRDGINGTLFGEKMTFVSGLTWSISRIPMGYVEIFDGSAFLFLGDDYSQSGSTDQLFTFFGQAPNDPKAVYVTASGGSTSGGFATEIPFDNLDGTYTFIHPPVAVFIEGFFGILGVDYTMFGNILTLINPGGSGVKIQSLYGGINQESPFDNGDGTYTFSRVPIAVYINGSIVIRNVDYTLVGLTMTAINPSGAGLLIQALY